MSRGNLLVSIVLVGVWLAISAFGFQAAPLPSSKLQDVEATKHGFDASQYEIVDTYQYDDFKVVQFNLSVLSHYSYAIRPIVSARFGWPIACLMTA